jgi:hypothetical protein
MTDLETRLRESLRHELDPVVAAPGRGDEVTRRARRARTARAAAVAVLTVSVAAAAVALVRRDDEALPPASVPETFAVFQVESAGATWRVAVDAAQGQVCYAADVLGAGVAHLHDAGGNGPVATFLDAPAAFPSHLCARIDGTDAQDVLDEPERFYLEFHSGDESLSGPLEERVPGELPDVAEIVCGPEGAVALTPEIRPQRDGIHLEIHNHGGDRGEFYLVDPHGGNEIGGLPEDGVRENVSSFGPGPLQIGCAGYAGGFSYDGTGSERHARLTIVDPEGLWTEPELECGDGRRRRTIPTDRLATEGPGVQPPVERLIREFVPGIEPGDVIERPRYPDSQFKIETRTLVRDGRRIARLYLSRGGGVWSVMPYVCPGYGIADPAKG